MKLVDLRTAIVANLKTAFPAIKSIDDGPSRLSPEELKRFSLKAPAFRVVFLTGTGGSTQSSGELCQDTRWAVYVVTRDKKRGDRDDQAIGHAQLLAIHIHQNQFGVSDVAPAEPPVIRNLYTVHTDKAGIALWAVEWRQTCRLEELAWS